MSKTQLRIAVIVLLITGASGNGSARILEMWPLDYVILKSQLIVQGEVVDDYFVIVDRVFLGQVPASKRIDFTTHLELTTILSSECDRVTMRAYGGLPCRTVKEKPAVLFLTKTNPTDKWETTGSGSGMKWLDNGEVLGYYQVQNPGGYLLLPEKRTPEDLYRAINDGLEKRSRYLAALDNQDPLKRIDGLLPFVQDPKQYLYWREAVFSLASTGPLAGESLRELAEKLKDNYSRVAVIEALGKSGDSNSTRYLIEIVEGAEPVVQKGALRFSAAGRDERTRMEEWKTALCALAAIGDKSALPLFRDSIFDAYRVEEFYGSQAAACIAQGLNKNPTLENLPVFQRLFTMYPQWYAWQGSTRWASWSAMEFLYHHKFKETIPLLLEQLDHPDVSTKQQAHQALIGIVGKDLGWSRNAWLEWYGQNRQSRN